MLSGVTPTTTTPWDSGSRLSAGIREGVAQLAGTDSVPQEGVIVVISDAAMSEPDEDAIAAVRGAVASGIEVHTIGVGSRGPGEGAASDRNGAGGATEFREPLLRRLAQIGGGPTQRARRQWVRRRPWSVSPGRIVERRGITGT